MNSPTKRILQKTNDLEVTPNKTLKREAAANLRKSPRHNVSRELFKSQENFAQPDMVFCSPSNSSASLKRSPGSAKSINFSDWDDSLNLYFSPKKKGSLKGSPSRSNKNKCIDFENFEEEDFLTDRETIVMKKNLVDIKNCFLLIDNYLPEEMKSQMKQKENFSYWTNMLMTKHFNILLYGVGSKKELLEDYIIRELSHSYYIVFDGFDKIVNARSILDTLNNEFSLQVAHRGLSTFLWAEKIAKAIENESIHLFIAIHNIDGPGLRDEDHQRALSILAKSPSISLIATVDHFNATLLWDIESRNNFQWLFSSCSTLKCYEKEIFASDSKILTLGIKQSEKLHTFASLDLFWKATTKNSHKILQQLALHSSNKNAELMLPDFCKILKAEFATPNETVLRQQLVEFCDHNLINLSRDGSIKLCVDQNLLIQFLEKNN